MKSARIQVFLSGSFDPKDTDLMDFFCSICRGLDIDCVNVDKASPSTPPEKALQLIIESQALIAIATCREETKMGAFMIPDAVHEEISMAYANMKPILPFIENGVDTKSGFFRNLSTYQTFDRGSIYSPEFLEKAISAIHSMKLDVISPHELGLEQHGQAQIFSEYSKLLVELVEECGSYKWRYSQTRQFTFTSKFIDPITTSVWADIPANKVITANSTPKWSYSLNRMSKPFTLTPSIEKQTGSSILIFFAIDPKPEKDDKMDFSTIIESPYFNPVFSDEILENRAQVIIDGVKYHCCDGVICSTRTKDMKVQYRFPASIKMDPNDFVPFVGSYTGKIDYIVESEIKRMLVRTDSFGGNVIIELSIESPLLRHVYGIAWNPPKNPNKISV